MAILLLKPDSDLMFWAKDKEICKQKLKTVIIDSSPNSPNRMASSPAAKDSTANLFISVPFDRDSNSNAPPATWCSVYRKQATTSTCQIKNRTSAMTKIVSQRAGPYLHEDEPGEAGSAVGDPLVPCNGARESRMFLGWIRPPEANKKVLRVWGFGALDAYGSRRPCGRRSRSHPCRTAGRAAAASGWTTTAVLAGKEGEVCPGRRRLPACESLVDGKYASYQQMRKKGNAPVVLLSVTRSETRTNTTAQSPAHSQVATTCPLHRRLSSGDGGSRRHSHRDCLHACPARPARSHWRWGCLD